jgi:adenylate kinase family enzyme
MVKDYVRREGDSADELRQIIKNGDAVPDHVIMKLLRQRLFMPDCKTNGWIIQGAPTSMDQISMLKDFDQQPNLFISLDMSDHLIYEKLEQRRFDPITN